MEFNYDQIKEKLKGYDLQTKIQLIALSQCLYDRKNLDHQQDQELDQMEADYKKRVEPLIEASNQIISGQRLVKEEEVEDLKEYLNAQEQPILDNKEPIENYWSKVLLNSKTLKAEVIGDKDEPLLKAITNIKGFENKEQHKLGLVFQFKANDYFPEEELKVEFLLDDKQGEPLKVESTKINWKEGKNISVKIVKKKNKQKKKVKEVEQKTIFQLFKNLDVKDWEKLEEDKKEEQQQKMDMCYDICRLIYDEILPYSLEYYLDVHVEDEDYEGDDMDDDESDDDEELTKEEAIKRMKERRGFKK
ncbi:unnamed protein product [Paramecium octaurelia]|uniref:Nucleosome assembly protein n=1 Tax=Paramecium octaurelia TaxID=43137 RepID=A0A8S1VD80_PAROT|nr:unnamed protein product [Paramecium octaurelia]